MSAAASTRDLAGWLAHLEGLHPREIELGLDRVRAVYEAMGQPRPAHQVITVAGTNGKGSSVAFLEAILAAAGRRVGSYTSPHLWRYNERVRLNGVPVDDAALCAAFARVEQARGEISLSYFEFGTLAALDLFAHADLDVAVLEVGLGGRLDAVNVVDTDIALVTAIDLDHTDWLGPDRDSIAREKAGISRATRPLICADPAPPDGLLQHGLGTPRWCAGSDFGLRETGDGQWDFYSAAGDWTDLPPPALHGAHQYRNAAGALAALMQLPAALRPDRAAVVQGLRAARLAGRLDHRPGAVTRIFDVAHNPAGAQVLADHLVTLPASGMRRTILGILQDKDAGAMIAALAPHTDRWYVPDLPGPRGGRAEWIESAIQRLAPDALIQRFVHPADAYRAAMTDSRPGDRVVVTGSFLTVALALPEPV
ncbi:MAG TPA: bifunctional tetrahydrofolate synthase/dihydrofolate synthase [Candidatus Macondimonas sp.]|nr:bifunctional tetrahydrofolate synthase/dihydrofolate synthase [Candidatus Macondimonas sp.]